MIAVDLFAGWGGFTLAAESIGVRVAWAANHWPLAVEAHAANHPSTAHACQDLQQADFSTLPAYDLLLAAPACQGHSSAAQPARARSQRVRVTHDTMRATAWAVIDCADVTEPRAIVVENVPEFARWRLFPTWLDALRALGYRIATAELVASIHADVPQRRRRLFIVATRGGLARLDLPSSPEPPIGPCLDFDAPAEWTRVRDASPGVQARIAKGRRHGTRRLTQHVTGHPGVPLSEPIRTITTKDQWALVDGDRYRPLTIRETARAMGFPDSYAWPSGATRGDVITGLGGAVPPDLAARVIARALDAA